MKTLKAKKKTDIPAELDLLLKLKNRETINKNFQLLLFQDNRTKEYLPSLAREWPEDNKKKDE